MQVAESSSLLWLGSRCHIFRPRNDELGVPIGALLQQSTLGVDNSSYSVKACFVYEGCEILCLFVLRPAGRHTARTGDGKPDGRKTQQVLKSVKLPQCCSGPRLLQLSWFPLCILVDEDVDRAEGL